MRKPIRLSRVAVSFVLATTGLAVAGFSVRTSGAATSSSGVTGAVSARSSSPSAPIVVANYTLNPKAVLIAADAVRFRSTDHTVVQKLTYLGTTPIAVGSILVVSTATGPFYGTVTAINGQSVTTMPASLGEIFSVLNLSVSSANGALSNGSPITGTASKSRSGTQSAVPAVANRPAVAVFRTDAPPAGSSVAPRLTASCSGSITTSANVAASANGGTFTLQAHWSWAHGLKSATITDSPSFSFSASAAVSGAGNCTLSQPVFSVDLPPIKFMIGWVPVWITQSISGDLALDIVASGSASVNVAYSAGATLGASKPSGGSWGAVRTGWVHKSTLGSLNVNATAKLSLPVSYEAALYGFGGLGVTVSPFANLTVNVNPPVCAPVSSLNLNVGADGSVYGFVHFGSLYDWSQTFAEVNFFTTDLINQQNPCPPITTHLNINTVANTIQSAFVPGVPSGNVLPNHSTVIVTDVGTAYKYMITVSDLSANSGEVFNVKPYLTHAYHLTHAGTYKFKIVGGNFNTNVGLINKTVTITVP